MTSLVGSALDTGYVKVFALINNETKAQFMLSAKAVNSFLPCSQEISTGKGCGDANCTTLTTKRFVEKFVGASAEGKYLKETRLCIGDWCSEPYIEPTFAPSNAPVSLPPVGVNSDSDDNSTTATPAPVPTSVPTRSPTVVPPSPKLGCSSSLAGSLKDAVDLGVWGIGPNGLHPDLLTLCFGTKKRPGRISAAFEPDVSPTHWLTYHSDFVLDLASATCPLQFLSPDTSWNDDDGNGLGGSITAIRTRVDFSSTYSYLPPRWFATAKQSLIAACQSLGCKGFRDYSDGAALVCFRFTQEYQENSLPDLEWRIENQVHLLVPPSRYLFTTEDGSRCIGVFESPLKDMAVLGLNLLVGLRLRIDYANSRMKLDTCVPTGLLPFDENPLPPGAGGGPSAPPRQDPIDHGGEESDSTAMETFTYLFLVLLFIGGIVLGVFLALQYKQKASNFGPKKKKSLFKASSLVRSGFASRKQTFRTVKFVEENDSSDEEASVAKQEDADVEMTNMTITAPRDATLNAGEGKPFEANGTASPPKDEEEEEKSQLDEGRGHLDDDRQRLLSSS